MVGPMPMERVRQIFQAMTGLNDRYTRLPFSATVLNGVLFPQSSDKPYGQYMPNPTEIGILVKVFT